ncbi:hypothetical protein EJB05_14299, partial [Eragrostis curvula]
MKHRLDNKHGEKVSAGHNIERLEMAHSNLEHALDRAGKLPITDVSLLRRRKILKRAFEECIDVIHRCKLNAQEDNETNQGRMVMNSSFPKRIARATKSSIAYFFNMKQDGLCCSDVRRFEWLADCAGKFLRDVESGCSIHHQTFCRPFLRHLLEGKIPRYEKVHGSQLHDFHIWPICLEERGIEAELSYQYEDYNMPERKLPSTYLASQFKLVAETAARELTLLPDLLDNSHSYTPPWVGSQESYIKLTLLCRPNPICCKSIEHETCANNISTSGLSNKFPEQVISISLQCSIHSSIDEVGRNDLIDRSTPLHLRAGFVPHAMLEGLTGDFCIKKYLGGDLRNVQEEIEMVKSKRIDSLIRQPELANYMTCWQYVHGFAFLQLHDIRQPSAMFARLQYRLKARRVAKRKALFGGAFSSFCFFGKLKKQKAPNQ